MQAPQTSNQLVCMTMTTLALQRPYALIPTDNYLYHYQYRAIATNLHLTGYCI